MNINVHELNRDYDFLIQKYGSTDGQNAIRSLFEPYIDGNKKTTEFKNSHPGLFKMLNELKRS